MSSSRIVAQPVVRRVLAAVLVVASVVASPSLAAPEQASARATADALNVSAVASATRSVLCDRTTRGVIERQYFAPRCPRGWRSAARGPVLCSRIADAARRTYPKRCPAGWNTSVVDQGLQCVIAQRTYTCRLTAGAPAPTTTVAPATTAAPTTTTLPPSASFDARGWEAEILRLTNIERQANGLGTLSACPRLATAALAHTNRMLEGQFFAHNDPGTGTSITDRIRATGYLDGAGAWRVAENIAMGYESAAATMTGWMNSPGHRANILTPELTHLGVGVSIGLWEAWRGTYSNWNSATMATQNFGTGGTC